MEKKTYVGYVIREVDYKDNDAIITILTKEGLKAFRATGIKKINSKNKSSCLLYAYSEFEVNEKNESYATLLSGNLIKYPHNITKSLHYMLIINLLSEYILNFEKREDLFILFSEAINKIENKIDYKVLLFALLNEMMHKEGCLLNVDSCIKCGETNNITYFSFEDGGYYCKKCTDKKEANLDFLKKIRILLKINFANCSKINKIDDNIYKIIENMFDILKTKSGINFYSKELLLKVLKKES